MMSTNDRIKRYILLEQSGELSPRKRAWLHRQLERDADARAWRDDHMALLSQTRRITCDEPLPDFTWEQIKQAARAGIRRTSGAPRRRPAADFIRVWKPALVYGSLSLLLAGVWMWWASTLRPGPDYAADQPAPVVAPAETVEDPNDPIDLRIAELYDLLEAALADDEDLTAYNGAYSLDDELNHIANELLAMEGS